MSLQTKVCWGGGLQKQMKHYEEPFSMCQEILPNSSLVLLSTGEHLHWRMSLALTVVLPSLLKALHSTSPQSSGHTLVTVM